MRSETARGIAAALVLGVTDERVSLADQLGRGALAALSPPDRARAQRLALATLRNLGRADAILKPFLRKRPPPKVQALLRVAVAEMFAENAPAHGVVSDAVGEARSAGRKAEGFAPLVNAVLRRAAETPKEKWASLPPDQLPGWFASLFLAAD